MQSAAILADHFADIRLTKTNGSAPAFRLEGAAIAANAGIALAFGDHNADFADGTPVVLPPNLIAGTDYEIVLNPDSTLSAHTYGAAKEFGRPVIGGFHHAPGGNASGRAGGNAEPAINPYSIYDLNFRPACPDPRGMALIDGRFWCDLYLLGTNHKTEGTSRWGAKIATGRTLDRLNYADAVAIMESHGKTLLGVTDFWAAAFGVTEKAALEGRPEIAGLLEDGAERFTSRHGLFQATGGVWVWGHDEDPDEPRASLFGGSWIGGSRAGSRCARLVYWPEDSGGHVGARGRSDHLNHD